MREATSQFWVNQGDSKRVREDISPTVYRLAIALLSREPKTLSLLSEETGLAPAHLHYYLKKSDYNRFYEQSPDVTWHLSDDGIEWVRNSVLPAIYGKGENDLFRVLE